jgi:hypothetical protein
MKDAFLSISKALQMDESLPQDLISRMWKVSFRVLNLVDFE